MKAAILHNKLDLRIEEYQEKKSLGPDDVRINIKSVGICGSDLHYYNHGRIGNFIVKEPLVLGHEASGEILELGSNVTSLEIGDLVCMEPGIPDMSSKAVLNGNYNLDPEVEFWATPPVDGCLRESVIHPSMFTYKLAGEIGPYVGSLIEPFAVGLQAAGKAQIKPGSTAVVFGCGTIGITTALAALLGGCSLVYIVDINDDKLKITTNYKGLYPINSRKVDLIQLIMDETSGEGVDIVFEATGNGDAIKQIFPLLRPAGKVVLIGMPIKPVEFDIVAAQCKEAVISTVFRYNNIYSNAIKLITEHRVDLKPLISKVFQFKDSVKAFETAGREEALTKVLIEFDG